jgi:AraC family transcriptional regulator
MGDAMPGPCAAIADPRGRESDIHDTTRHWRPAGDAVTSGLRISKPPTLWARSSQGPQIGITHIICAAENLGASSIPPDDIFYAALYLADFMDYELWRSERRVPPMYFPANSMRIAYLGDRYRGNVRCVHEALGFTIRPGVLKELCEENDWRRIGSLACEPGTIDPIMINLGTALMSAFGEARHTSLFVDHVGLAVAVHLAQRYGGMTGSASISKGGLCPSHARRIEEFVRNHLSEDVTLAALAEQVDLSRAHFVRAFRVTFGRAPHQWLLFHRIGRAKTLLRTESKSISHIAAECGFADQSHLTRVFSRFEGIGPAAWRRRSN